MKRRTLDLLTSIGGLGLALLLLVAGLVLTSNANFAKSYVHDQMAQQKITFKTVDKLTDEEKAMPGLIKYAGQDLLTGKQAEVYANEFIGLHLRTATKGLSYAELGVPAADAKAKLTAAKDAGVTDLTALEKDVATTTATRETAFKGETLRGLLLTSFGFSELGRKADQFSKIAYLGSALFLLLALAGFAHALRTSKDKVFGAPEPARTVVRV
ncbi:MAG: hypothetical protein ABIM89_10415 [Mycobacteriales bacterium]